MIYPFALGTLFSILFFVFIDWLPLQSFGPEFALFDIAILLSLIVFSSGIILSFLGLLSKRTRTISLKIMVFIFATIIFSIPSIMIGEKIRMKEFEKLAIRSSELIQAIELFRKNEGKLPLDLKDLVPKYLENYPYTGMSAYPEYMFSKSEDDINWSLVVFCGKGVLNFDEFWYSSNKSYPDTTSITSIGDWVYYHE